MIHKILEAEVTVNFESNKQDLIILVTIIHVGRKKDRRKVD